MALFPALSVIVPLFKLIAPATPIPSGSSSEGVVVYQNESIVEPVPPM